MNIKKFKDDHKLETKCYVGKLCKKEKGKKQYKLKTLKDGVLKAGPFIDGEGYSETKRHFSKREGRKMNYKVSEKHVLVLKNESYDEFIKLIRSRDENLVSVKMIDGLCGDASDYKVSLNGTDLFGIGSNLEFATLNLIDKVKGYLNYNNPGKDKREY